MYIVYMMRLPHATTKKSVFVLSYFVVRLSNSFNIKSLFLFSNLRSSFSVSPPTSVWVSSRQSVCLPVCLNLCCPLRLFPWSLLYYSHPPYYLLSAISFSFCPIFFSRCARRSWFVDFLSHLTAISLSSPSAFIEDARSSGRYLRTARERHCGRVWGRGQSLRYSRDSIIAIFWSAF